MEREYKDWRIAIRANKTPHAEGWRVYANLSYWSGGSVRTKQLYFTDGRTFPTETAAEAAGVQMAKAWIDHEG